MKATSAVAAPPVAASGALELYDAQLTQQLDAYYDRTKLLAVVQDFVRELTQRFATARLVPMDVYAPLLAHVRLAEINATELLASSRPRDLTALAGTTPPQELLLFDPRDGRSVPMERQIATFKAQPPPPLALWGLRRVLERIPYSGQWQHSVEAKYELAAMWLSESEATDEACVVRCAGTLVGYDGFFTMATRAHTLVEIERHVVVVGEQLEQAMTAFARQLIRSLFEATKKNAVVALPQTEAKLTLVGVGAIQISNPRESQRNDGANDLAAWTMERVTSNRQAFVTAVKMALVANAGFVIDLLYERSSAAKSSSVDGDQEPSCDVVRCRVEFFFHYDEAAHAKAGAAATKATATPSKSRSFVSQSRLHESGLFISTRSAYDLTRRVYEQQEHDGDAGATASTRSSSQLEGLISRVVETTRSSVESRHWLGLLSCSLAFRLARLLSLIDGMLHAVRVVVAEDESAIPALVFQILGSSIHFYQEMTHELVEDAAVGRSASLLKGLSGVLQTLCSLPQDDIQLENVDAFYEQLQCSREAIDWLFSGASCDFVRLVTLTTTGQTALAVARSADLRADISAAIEERSYPPAIVAETVFAQYLVNTLLDVALERSLVNTVACGLPPNPFVPFSGHLRTFAAHSMIERTTQRPQATPPVEIQALDGVGFAVQVPAPLKQLVSANRRLLQHLNVARLTGTHSFLTRQQVYRSAPYNPSKASYSARISTSLMIDDPVFFLPEPVDEILVQQIEVVEHVVIEGSDHAQALWFFADAVRRDVQRLLMSDSTGSAQLALLDPNGDVLTTVELREIQTFEQLLAEATPKQCTLQITLPPQVAEKQTHNQPPEPLLRLVTKSYLFHHVSSSPATEYPSSISVRNAFRLRTFAVFMEVEPARTALAFASSQRLSACELRHQTSYAQRAIDENDALQLQHLAWISSSSAAQLTAAADPPPALLLRLLDVDSCLRWLLDRILESATASAVGSSPRSAADAAASLCVNMLPRIVHIAKRLLLPLVETVGLMDVSSLNDAMATVGALATRQTAGDAWVHKAEACVRRLWVLLRLLRVAFHTDAVGQQQQRQQFV